MEELCNDFAAVLESERAAGHTLSFLVSIHCHGFQKARDTSAPGLFMGHRQAALNQ